MDFDFIAYLEMVDPGQKYVIEQLIGGLVNITARATKQLTPLQGTGRFPGHSSVVLKYAPPYIAAIGETAPFSQARQFMEANALRHFTSPSGILQDLGQGINVKIPHLLLYDEMSHVIVIEDLGQVIPLERWITNFSDEPVTTELGELANKSRIIGQRIGQFFARLHSRSTLEKVLQSTSVNSLINSFGTEVVLENCISPIEGKLGKYLPATDQSLSNSRDQVQKLFQRILDNFIRPTTPGEQSFVLGDFYPGSLLLPADWDEGSAISVIDWEFSGVGRGPHADMAQCLAHMHIALASSKEDSERHIAVHSLTQGICEAYKMLSLPWIGSIGPRITDLQSRTRLEMLRSALILFGGEIVSQGCDNDFYNFKVDGILFAGTGASYIERAGRSVEEMVQPDNWKALVGAKNDLVLWLFEIGTD